jgi:Pyruvate/2-oxoacid:ferredoxin oxidoreductase delta subunit
MNFSPSRLLVRASTRRFLREARSLQTVSLVEALHGYLYQRWPYLYIAVATGEHPLGKALDRAAGLLRLLAPRRMSRSGKTFARKFADSYHGKVIPLDAASRLVSVGRDLNRGDLEKVVPYSRARDLVLRNADHIVVLDCPCRAARDHPCEPRDVCLIIGDPFASFVEEHHPGRSRRITAGEAVRILQEEDARGHVHHAFFKDAMLGRFYAICNCCSCCCGAMAAHRGGIPMLASSGYVSEVNEELCQGCGECAEFCQFGAISLTNGISSVSWDLCMGCGVCLTKCAHGALSLVADRRKGFPLEIDPPNREAREALQREEALRGAPLASSRSASGVPRREDVFHDASTGLLRTDDLH